MLKRKIGNAVKLLFLFALLGVLLTTCDYADFSAVPERDSNLLYIEFIDVGQGDCALLKLPGGENMLIDAGDNESGKYVVDFIKSEGIKKLDYVIGTHPHADHIGGLDDVINNFEIGKIYMPKVTSNTKTFEDVLLAIKNKGMKVEPFVTGQDIVDGDVYAEFISPIGDYYEELNDYSAVLKLTYGEKTFLFMGDAETFAEKEMLKNFNVRADVLKVGHHGSSTSSHQAFVNAVKPDVAVISVGEGNDYGHPHSKVLKRYEKRNTDILRTDLCGNILITCNGEEISIFCESDF